MIFFGMFLMPFIYFSGMVMIHCWNPWSWTNPWKPSRRGSKKVPTVPSSSSICLRSAVRGLLLRMNCWPWSFVWDLASPLLSHQYVHWCKLNPSESQASKIGPWNPGRLAISWRWGRLRDFSSEHGKKSVNWRSVCMLLYVVICCYILFVYIYNNYIYIIIIYI